MRAVLLAAASVHAALLVALALTIGADGGLRPCLALTVATVVSGGWVVWLYRQDVAAELLRPPVSSGTPVSIGRP